MTAKTITVYQPSLPELPPGKACWVRTIIEGNDLPRHFYNLNDSLKMPSLKSDEWIEFFPEIKA